MARNESIKNAKSEYIVGLDIGTNRVIAVVGQKQPDGKFDIVGHGVSKVPPQSIFKGYISNINHVTSAIADAIGSASSIADIEIDEVYCGVTGKHIATATYPTMYSRKNVTEPIDEQDMAALHSTMENIEIAEGHEIIDLIPLDFKLDDKIRINDPIGNMAKKIEANYTIVTFKKQSYEHLERCLKNNKLKLKKVFLNSVASGEAVLLKDEKEAGVALIDLGAANIDIAIYHSGSAKYTKVLPIGCELITSDVQSGCLIQREQAESLKIRFGASLALPEDENHRITIPGIANRESKEISAYNLAKIIEARMDELIDIIHNAIQESGYENELFAGIVLTGGGSSLNRIKMHFERKTGLETKIGLPNTYLNTESQKNNQPSLSTAIGLIILGDKDNQLNPTVKKVVKDKKIGKTIFGGVTNWIKEQLDDNDNVDTSFSA